MPFFVLGRRWPPAPAGKFSPHAGASTHGNGISKLATHPPQHADAPSLQLAAVASQTSWQSVLDLWTQFGESCIFVRSNLLLSGTNLGVLCTPDRSPPFCLGSLASEVGQAVLSRTSCLQPAELRLRCAPIRHRQLAFSGDLQLARWLLGSCK